MPQVLPKTGQVQDSSLFWVLTIAGLTLLSLGTAAKLRRRAGVR